MDRQFHHHYFHHYLYNAQQPDAPQVLESWSPNQDLALQPSQRASLLCFGGKKEKSERPPSPPRSKTTVAPKESPKKEPEKEGEKVDVLHCLRLSKNAQKAYYNCNIRYAENGKCETFPGLTRGDVQRFYCHFVDKLLYKTGEEEEEAKDETSTKEDEPPPSTTAKTKRGSDDVEKKDDEEGDKGKNKKKKKRN